MASFGLILFYDGLFHMRVETSSKSGGIQPHSTGITRKHLGESFGLLPLHHMVKKVITVLPKFSLISGAFGRLRRWFSGGVHSERKMFKDNFQIIREGIENFFED